METHADWLGRHFDLLLHPEDVDVARALFQKAREGHSLPRFELRVRTSRGDYMSLEFLLVTRVRRRFAGANPRHLQRHHRTETAGTVARSGRIDAPGQGTAEEASRAKSEFLSNVSHEIRTPLQRACSASTSCWLSTLSCEQSPAEVHEYLGNVRTARPGAPGPDRRLARSRPDRGRAASHRAGAVLAFPAPRRSGRLVPVRGGGQEP